MRNAESRRREFLSHVRSKHQSGSSSFDGPVGAAPQRGDRWPPPAQTQRTVVGSCLQEHFHGRCFSLYCHRALKIRTGLVVLDVDTGVFDDGHRRCTLHSTERKAKANFTFRPAGCTHISGAPADFGRTSATSSERDRRDNTPSRSRDADTSSGFKRKQVSIRRYFPQRP